ncbi:MAG: ATP-dependent DNA helicase RecG, partial [Pelagibacterales bacterium]|nr:ATP-dependent DNA helicase RecG [Pelagibacterales bacterium]
MNLLLLEPLRNLKQVGEVFALHLSNLVGGNKFFNLLLHKPIRVEKISFCPRLFEVQNDELVIIKARIESYVKPSKSKQPHKIVCYTPSGFVNLIFFKVFPGQIERLKIGREIAILGNLQKLHTEYQIVHPLEIIDSREIDNLPKVNVIYPLASIITQKFLRYRIQNILRELSPQKEEWIDANLVQKQDWVGFIESLKNLHYFIEKKSSNQSYVNQNSFNKEKMAELARQRLAYDELLAWQIAVLIAKNKTNNEKKLLPLNNNLADEFLISLPFTITTAQKKVIAEIKKDICSNKKMLRLLQGDVGSGKTIVAIFACLLAKSQNKQSCVIVPISVLAKQHFSYFQKLLKIFNIKVEILTGANTKKQKEKILKNLVNGEIDILISTHAAIEEDVTFKNLGLVVIDEQHRFGVMQRLKMVEKGDEVDVLLMSATPIPRSLMMALYGDMDISIINEKPQNRQEIETLVMSEKKAEEIHDSIKRKISRGEKVYWICPAIEENTEEEPEEDKAILDNKDLVSVKKKHQELSKIFGDEAVALLHGKMKESEKEKIMNDFANIEGKSKILVATTVIEVGIDVGDATVIVIENSENFGLSQLHQLRGRVGRSEKKSYCILLYGEKFGATARKRLG